MKLRWSNGHSFAIEFEANDPESFYRNAMMHLDLYRAQTARRVHRGETHKNVIWHESVELGIYVPSCYQWYNPEGEACSLETQSFGNLAINRHFTVRAEFRETPVDKPTRDYAVTLIAHDPLKTERLDLSQQHDSGRIWNLCIGVDDHARIIDQGISGIMHDLERYTEKK